MTPFQARRDHYAGGLVALLGAGAIFQGSHYEIGTLMRTGPGTFPVALGVALVIVGLLIAGTAMVGETGGDRVLPADPPWFGWACIVAGPVCFIVLGTYLGMIPAIFACVFVCAIGDRAATVRTSLILAAAMTVCGAVLFGLVLGIQFPLLRWG